MGEAAKAAGNDSVEAGGTKATSGVVPVATPRTFGRLLLLKLLARGGMGDVFLAATTGIEGTERPCVVKTVRRDHIHDASFLARFLDEARVQAQLNHAGVAQVLEASTDENGEPFTVVEYIEGRSLADVRQRAAQLGTRIGWADAVALTIEMTHALAHVHERPGADGTPLGIVHRDLSPQNVMVAYSGEVKLIDFGTARGQNRRCHTVAGVVFAKPGYVAPEVARQQVGDARIDLYAVGVMLWELVSGRRYLSGDPQKHLEEAAAGTLVMPKLAPKVGAPSELDLAIVKLTASDPDERYTNAASAATDLGRLLGQAPEGKSGERSVRGRVANLMRSLWPNEPSRSRAEFVKLLKHARSQLRDVGMTPGGSRVTLPPERPERASNAPPEPPADPNVLPGTPYRLGRVIGEGASGIVHEAEHVELGRKVAIKLLAPECASEGAFERFRREARAIASLSHANVAHLYDFGRAQDGRVFLAMELLAGETLAERLRREKGMDWREAVDVAIQVTRALDAAHAASIVHRDLKPQNLFVTQKGVVKLLDFGLAIALSESRAEKATADALPEEEKKRRGFAVFGTPEYMAPEQVAGEEVSAQADLYALGCVLYELVTGKLPFEGSSGVAVIGKQLREVAEPPRMRAPDRNIPTELESVIQTALAKKPHNRFDNAAAMRDALEACLAPHAPRPPRRAVRAIAKLAIASASVFTLVAFLPVVAPTASVALRASAGRAFARFEHPQGSEDPSAPPAPNDAPAPTPLDVPTASLAAASPAAAAVASTLASTGGGTADEPDALAASDLRSEKSRAFFEARQKAKNHPGDVKALKGWATAALAAGDYREARKAAAAWALRDGSVEPRLFQATVLEAQGHRSEARAMATELASDHPESSDARALANRLGAPTGGDLRRAGLRSAVPDGAGTVAKR